MLNRRWVVDTQTEDIVRIAEVGDSLAWNAHSEICRIDPHTGLIMNRTKGHKSKLTTLAASQRVSRFASGDESGMVIIWRTGGEGIVKFNMGSSITALSFNPITTELACGSGAELGIWSNDKPSILRVPLHSKSAICEWSPTGSALVACTSDSRVFKMDRVGKVLWSKALAVNLLFACMSISSGDLCAIGSWNIENGVLGSIWLIALDSPEQDIRKIDLKDQRPTSIKFVSDDSLVTGSREGTVDLVSVRYGRLATLSACGSWITSLVVSPTKLFLSTSKGTIEAYDFTNPAVHAVHKTKYAVRDTSTLTDVSIDDLSSSSEPRIIPTGKLVLKIALYCEKLAALFEDGIEIFCSKTGETLASFPSDHGDVCLMLLCDRHVVLCYGLSMIHVVSFEGIREQEWTFRNAIRYMRVIDGPAGRESVLICLSNGSVRVGNIGDDTRLLVNHKADIQTADINIDKSILGVLDDIGVLNVYSLESGDVLSVLPGATSLAFSQTHSHILSLTHSDGHISILNINNQRRLDLSNRGLVISFYQNKVMTLINNEVDHIHTAEISCLFDTSPFEISYDSWLSIFSICRDTEFILHVGKLLTGEGHFEAAKNSFSGRDNGIKFMIDLLVGTTVKQTSEDGLYQRVKDILKRKTTVTSNYT